MRHDERHAALAAYAFWCKLEQTGEWKGALFPYYVTLFDVRRDPAVCPACVIAERSAEDERDHWRCSACPCDWSPGAACEDSQSPYGYWKEAQRGSSEHKKHAGDVANIMRKWCERVGVIAPRKE